MRKHEVCVSDIITTCIPQWWETRVQLKRLRHPTPRPTVGIGRASTVLCDSGELRESFHLLPVDLFLTYSILVFPANALEFS